MSIEHSTIVVFPATVFTAIARTINFHHDDREIALNLYGVVHRDGPRTAIVPFGLIGTGIERIRYHSACNVDFQSRYLALDSLSASHGFSPKLHWAEVGNHHRHPIGYGVPSYGDKRSAGSFLTDLVLLPFYLIGIFHQEPAGMELSTFVITRAHSCIPVPWVCIDLPSFADPDQTIDEAWSGQPLRISSLVSSLTTRGGPPPTYRHDQDGGLHLTTSGASYRIAPSIRSTA